MGTPCMLLIVWPLRGQPSLGGSCLCFVVFLYLLLCLDLLIWVLFKWCDARWVTGHHWLKKILGYLTIKKVSGKLPQWSHMTVDLPQCSRPPSCIRRTGWAGGSTPGSLRDSTSAGGTQWWPTWGHTTWWRHCRVIFQDGGCTEIRNDTKRDVKELVENVHSGKYWLTELNWDINLSQNVLKLMLKSHSYLPCNDNMAHFRVSTCKPGEESVIKLTWGCLC